LPEITPLRPGVWLVEARLEEFSVRGAVLAGTERVVVWDTLARPADMGGVAELVPDLPLSVVYSHGDWDHVWGTVGLSRRCHEIIAHHLCLHRFITELEETLEGKRREGTGAYDLVRLVPPTRTFQTRMTVELGGANLELHHLPGHTPDTLVGFIPEWRVFLAGDAAEMPFPFLNPGNPIEPWVKRLESWSDELETEEPPTIVVPSHGQIGGPELLRKNARYLKDLLAGRPPSIPETLAPFYAETDQANLALARQG
jgi:glyoxylase-like metal-dependent hydrolase (beta-lactamase superfamily II)